MLQTFLASRMEDFIWQRGFRPSLHGRICTSNGVRILGEQLLFYDFASCEDGEVDELHDIIRIPVKGGEARRA
jgi:hypothetical protein